jgi:hypothetical protein
MKINLEQIQAGYELFCNQRFQGWFTPVEIVVLVLTGQMSDREHTLYCIIRGLQNHKSGKGCCARNAKLASYLRCSEQHVQKMIAHLKKLRVIYQSDFDGRWRYLKTSIPDVEGILKVAKRSVEQGGRGRIHTAPDSAYRRPMNILNTNVLSNSETRSRKRPAGDPFDLRFCDILRTRLLEVPSLNRKLATYNWSTRSQVKEVAHLRKAIKDKQHILDVLKWYVTHLHETKEYKLPTCISPKEIRKRWDWIEQIYEKRKERDNPIVISDECKSIVKRLMMLKWPKGSDIQLTHAVQVSLDNYKKFRKKLWEAETPLARYTNQSFSAPDAFVLGWFQSVHKQIRSWDDWNGDLFALRFTADNKKLTAMGRDIAQRYSHQAKDWDDLMETLK